MYLIYVRESVLRSVLQSVLQSVLSITDHSDGVSLDGLDGVDDSDGVEVDDSDGVGRVRGWRGRCRRRLGA